MQLLLLFGWRKLAWQHDTWALPWCKAKSMRWWKGGPAVGNTCSLVVRAPMWAHWIYSVLLSLSPTEDCLSDSSFLHTGLFPLPLGLICASCLETVQEQSQLRGLVHGTSHSSVPLVLMPVHLRSSVPASFPLRLSVSLVFLIRWNEGGSRGDEVRRLNTNNGSSESKESVCILRHCIAELPFCLCLQDCSICRTLKGKEPRSERRRLLELNETNQQC